MCAFGEQMEVEIGEHAPVAIRVVDLDPVARRKRDAQAVVVRIGDADFEQTCRVPPRHGTKLIGGHQVEIDGHGRRLKRAHDDAGPAPVRLWAEHRKRVAILAGRKRRQSALEHGVVAHGHHGDLSAVGRDSPVMCAGLKTCATP